mmetsp:Transcript_150248/g.262535  ORF Transcript_150248/g.262535 Transcript_150248/m.262535 type:complete len:118 (-) Transcript_150248:86-439(-)
MPTPDELDPEGISPPIRVAKGSCLPDALPDSDPDRLESTKLSTKPGADPETKSQGKKRRSPTSHAARHHRQPMLSITKRLDFWQLRQNPVLVPDWRQNPVSVPDWSPQWAQTALGSP